MKIKKQGHKVILRLLFLIFIVLPINLFIILPIQFIIIKLNLPFWNILPRFTHSLGCILLGIRVKTIGSPVLDRPTLLVANHISWADILALGSTANISFVAKSEIKNWPLIGFLASLQKTIFVKRTKRGDTKRASNEMAERLKNNGALVLFAEGGSDIGAHILPFKSALVGAAQKAMNEAGANNINIQPVTIAYIKLQGLPVSRGDRLLLAWNKSKSPLQNLTQILKRSIIQITIVYGNPIALKEQTNRKQITKQCHAIVRKKYSELTRATISLPIKTPLDKA